MSIPNSIPARLHLLRAHDAPIIAVIRRGPSKLFHVIKWNTEKDKLEYGSWNGGGYWRDTKTLMTNHWLDQRGHVPFKIEPMNIGRGEDEGVLYAKMARDGWKRNGDNWGIKEKAKNFRTRVVGDDGWSWQFGGKGPKLQCFFRGYLEHGRTFEFRVQDNPELLDETVEWVTFDARGHLVVARAGWIERYSPANIKSGRPGFRLDLNGLTHPPREI